MHIQKRREKLKCIPHCSHQIQIFCDEFEGMVWESLKNIIELHLMTGSLKPIMENICKQIKIRNCCETRFQKIKEAKISNENRCPRNEENSVKSREKTDKIVLSICLFM